MGNSSSRPDTRRRSRLHRASSNFSTSIPQLFNRRRTRDSAPTTRPNSIAISTPSRLTRSFPRSLTNDLVPISDSNTDFTLPRLQLGDQRLDLDFDALPGNDDPLPQRRNQFTTSRRGEESHRRSYFDRVSALRRRRRSPLRRHEDQAALLSRLLSVAAEATAASLMGDDHRSVSEARNFGGDDEDGTFDSFLQALQNGRIASALRGENTGEGEATGMPAPLNFFRMFRFGTGTANRRIESDRPSTNHDGDASDQHNEEEGRMVPIIIVGIRSITPGAGASQDDNIPPFLDALSTFPSPLNSPGEPLDGIFRQPTPTTRFSHRRRASMGGFPTTYDNQRHHPRPPPSTPASSALSAVSSGNTTPVRNSTATHSATPSRRESFVRRPTGGLESTAEEPSQQRTARQRRLSESDFARFGSGSARRNGVVEPDHNPGEGSRSWIIYVLGGSYPENHPILTTPSLFTDSPTYEDMVLLSALLGPAKPPVATEADVAAAPGLFRIIAGEDGRIIARAESVLENDRPKVDENVQESAERPTPSILPHETKRTEKVASRQETIAITPDQRCLVCLCEFEVGEEARRLVQCEHFFHRECIDQWLLNGRNSCPLCRRKGVEEKTSSTSSDTEASDSSPTARINNISSSGTERHTVQDRPTSMS